jgi:hypothetical protein
MLIYFYIFNVFIFCLDGALLTSEMLFFLTHISFNSSLYFIQYFVAHELNFILPVLPSLVYVIMNDILTVILQQETADIYMYTYTFLGDICFVLKVLNDKRNDTSFASHGLWDRE